MVTKTLSPAEGQSATPKSYSDFSLQLGWKLHELQFRLKAAHDLLTNNSAYDSEDMDQLGVSYRHKGEFQKARNAYEQAIALDDNYADAHLNLGVLLDLYVGDGALALAHYERYLMLSPTGDAAVGKWVADLRNRKPASVAQAGVKLSKKE